MPGQFANEPMVDMFIFETSQLLEQLEDTILNCEKSGGFNPEAINEIFRIMHTIKGSSAMMLYNEISELTHSVEDLFFLIREGKPINVESSVLNDLVFESIDFIKLELVKIKNRDPVDGDAQSIRAKILQFVEKLKDSNPQSAPNTEQAPASNKKAQYYISQTAADMQTPKFLYKAEIFFEAGCGMENIRAYTIIHILKDIAAELRYFPEDIIENDDTVHIIREKGFVIYFRSDQSYNKVHELLMKSVFLRELHLDQLEQDENTEHEKQNLLSSIHTQNEKSPIKQESQGSAAQGYISVAVTKLDKLMDLIGEIVIAEAMVTQNPDLKGLNLDNFYKSARQLRKITSELQDTVMAVRMVPLSTTFHKMHRIARDMSKKLDKEVNLVIHGEETEVDKSIIEHISDPIMHLVRNSIDHGIESKEERIRKGKNINGTVFLEANNAGNDVIIHIRDDGKGLNKQKIIEKAIKNNLLTKPAEEMTEKEIYNLIFLPGFSTKEMVTEFSGRGVGMDVVTKNIEQIGGNVSVDSTEGAGTIVTIKIPLTLAIINGMNVKVGNAGYTIPTTAIKQSFRPNLRDIIVDPDGKEMIMVRGRCHSIVRLHRIYDIQGAKEDFQEGIFVMVEHEDTAVCIFADELLGEQQVVVKSLPQYIKRGKRISGLSGCTLLGDGSISLIIDVSGFFKK